MVKKLLLTVILAVSVVCSAGSAVARVGSLIAQHIPETVFINGQQVQGVTVVQNGTLQSPACPSPQQYVTIDRSSSGWACFDETTGVWLLHALPPQQGANAYEQPPYYYPDESTVYGYYGYPYYPYGYYPYYGYGPSFGFGFGFGHDHHERHGHESFGHGSFGHGGGGHGGGGHGRGGRR